MSSNLDLLLYVCLSSLLLWILLFPLNRWFFLLRLLFLLLGNLLLCLLIICLIWCFISTVNLVYQTILKITILSLIYWGINDLLLPHFSSFLLVYLICIDLLSCRNIQRIWKYLIRIISIEAILIPKLDHFIFLRSIITVFQYFHVDVANILWENQ